ncbi:1-phosphofructokinase [Aneurinibacillus terranovensis]|uniref:1-phosphofructokinase n=1 Tax=Aneurinibacillus terranovensis TaxID=278991 RepID=UPI000415B04A|nr:1-phosphofructokinase [Aneurinibacillus terranovensis]
MIYTLTLNPSLDYFIQLPTFKVGTINRVQHEWKRPGGKGINVSQVLKNLGTESTAFGFIGGFTGRFIEDKLKDAGISTRFLPVEGDSRINIKAQIPVETEISGASPAISKQDIDALFDQLNSLTEGDYLVLSGSVPASVEPAIYERIMRALRPKGVRIFLDARGEALRNGLAEQPFLIKPNHHELGELFNVKIESPEQAIAYARKTLPMGARNVIVSLAGAGAVFVNETEAYIAHIPKANPVNSIGAGDSVVAGFLFKHAGQVPIPSAFLYAVAAGSATALSEGFCTPEKIEAYLPSIILTKVE